MPEIAKISASAAWAGSDWRLLRIRVACHESFRAAVCRVYEDDVGWLTPWRIDGQECDRVLEQLRHRMGWYRAQKTAADPAQTLPWSTRRPVDPKYA
jgi:hypothetical protein